jgi:hypothetical protein
MPNAPRRPPGEPAAAGPETSAPVDPIMFAWLVALVLAVIGAVVGMLFLYSRNPPSVGPATGLGVFAAVFVLAAAIERLLEPLNYFRPLGGDTAADPRLRPRRAAICLGLASALAMIACGFFGLGLLHAFGDTGAPRYVDVVVSGLGIGAATKPLHDLILGLERWAHPGPGSRP